MILFLLNFNHSYSYGMLQKKMMFLKEFSLALGTPNLNSRSIAINAEFTKAKIRWVLLLSVELGLPTSILSPYLRQAHLIFQLLPDGSQPEIWTHSMCMHLRGIWQMNSSLRDTNIQEPFSPGFFNLEIFFLFHIIIHSYFILHSRWNVLSEIL